MIVTIYIERETLNAYGEDKLNAEIFAFTRALIDHAFTIDTAAPTAHPFVERIVRESAGKYIVIEPEPIIPEVPPELSLDELHAQAFETIKRNRSIASRSGVMLNGVKFTSDNETLTALIAANAEALASVDPTKWTTRWRIGPGSFVLINHTNVKFLILAIRAKHAAAFDNERALSDEIVSSHSIKTLAKVDLTKGWDI